MFPRRGAQRAAETLYVEDVFSAYTYTGNSGTQNIVNGIDLAGEGGLVWIKNRSSAIGHILIDTERGSNVLSSETTAAQSSVSWGLTFNNDGYSLTTSAGSVNNGSNFVSWTFRKAPKFFAVVTYTGNGANRTIPHSLGIDPGMVIVKRTDTTGGWLVSHRSLANTQALTLNTTNAVGTDATVWNSTTATSTDFSLGTSTAVNANGGTYVAYLFAHDDSDDGIIQCGSFSGNTTIDLGWEPQFIMTKRTDSTGDWRMLDTARGWDLGTSDKLLLANSTAAETSSSYGEPNASGFATLNHTGTNVYVAIRKGNMRVPTDASEVFDPFARVGTGAAASISGSTITQGVDLVINKARTYAHAAKFADRLRGTNSQLDPTSSGAATTLTTHITSFNKDGVDLGASTTINTNGALYINYLLKQARGFFDIVSYKGTGVAHSEQHNLGVPPELMIVRGSSNTSNWCVYYGDPTKYLLLNTTDAASSATTPWDNTAPTDTEFTLGNLSWVNANNATNIAYLFASAPGVSKIGTYIGAGVGTALPVDCGFAAGARFVLIKRINVADSWYYWDSTRGITTGDDPFMLMNTTSVETTNTDYIDPYSAGFEISSSATVGLNNLGDEYLFWAIA